MRMLDRHRRRTPFLLLLALVALGCGPGATSGGPHRPASVPHEQVGLPIVDERGGFEREWRKPELDLAAYDRILLLPIELVYTERFERNHRNDGNRYGRHWPPKARRERQREKDLALLRTIFRETLEAELRRGGVYTLVDEPGPGVLSLSVGVVDLDLARSHAELNLRGLTAFDRIPTITIRSSIRDGATAEHLGVMVQPSTSFGTVSKSGAGGALWGSVRIAFDRWARSFGAMLETQRTAAMPASPGV